MNSRQPAESTIYSLFSFPAEPAQRRAAFYFAAFVALTSLLITPFVRLPLPPSPAYQAVLFGPVICFELMTVFVLYSQYRVARSPAILAVAAGYWYSALMTGVYLLTFPGIVSRNGLFHASPQTAEYVYIFWHAGFPAAILLHVILEAFSRKRRPIGARPAHLLAGAVFLAVAALVCLLAYIACVHWRRLPLAMDFGRVTPVFLYAFGLPVLLLSLLALIVYYRATGGRTVPSLWLCVALLATMLDVGLAFGGGQRFSLGWYVSKWDTFVFAAIVLSGMLYEFTRMYRSLAALNGQVTESEAKYRTLFEQSRLAARKIAEQRDIIERMMASSREAIARCDSDGTVLFVNGRFAPLFGKPLRVGESLAAYCRGMKAAYGGLPERIGAYLAQRDDKPFRERVTVGTGPEGERHFDCYASPIVDEADGKLHGYLFAFGDRTEEERKANYDELTGLPNRRLAGERLQQATARAQASGEPLAVFFMDLDGFKKVNDTLGHDTGDRLLQEVAELLRVCVGDRGLCARWAGDEFVVVLDAPAERQELAAIAQETIAATRRIERIDGQRVAVSASIGIAVSPGDGDGGLALLQRADRAMYEAKLRGKSNWFFYADIGGEASSSEAG
ncbi:diguanylate cyclase domain-containing protein [Paenibacillus cymbidii]|uniref:diguanylate cyclase domain-containing protein n=1 Tax=Paenibacillus cymbidii TaxID=1639034 RepID=UPI001436C9F9|nr:diguanylate cyclase [Paenibacillus cymbidii]